MINATGAIYVIGGEGSGTLFNDVYVSTNGGARPDSVGEGSKGYYRGTTGVLRECVRLAAACAPPSHGGDLRYL